MREQTCSLLFYLLLPLLFKSTPHASQLLVQALVFILNLRGFKFNAGHLRFLKLMNLLPILHFGVFFERLEVLYELTLGQSRCCLLLKDVLHGCQSLLQAFGAFPLYYR